MAKEQKIGCYFCGDPKAFKTCCSHSGVSENGQ